MLILSFLFHCLHIVCATFWVGSLLYTELILWPRLRASGQLEQVQGELRQVAARKVMAIFIVGTIATGYLRAIFGGAFDRLFSLYGQFFVVGSLIGIAMMVWWACFPPRSMRLGWRSFYASFWLVLLAMVGMRFAA